MIICIIKKSFNKHSKYGVIMKHGPQIFYYKRRITAKELAAKLTTRKSFNLIQRTLIRILLMQAMRCEKYESNTVCSQCSHKLTMFEILNGFNNVVTSVSTTCPKCEARFYAYIACSSTTTGDDMRVEMPLYGAIQTLDILEADGENKVSPYKFRSDRTGIYHSALIHFGSMKKAFSKIGIDYPFEENQEWRWRIICWVGQFPDTLCASVSNASISTLRRNRVRNNIPACKGRGWLKRTIIR
jgi:hypothetical protein